MRLKVSTSDRRCSAPVALIDADTGTVLVAIPPFQPRPATAILEQLALVGRGFSTEQLNDLVFDAAETLLSTRALGTLSLCEARHVVEAVKTGLRSHLDIK